jgi:hypothetical protein
MEHVRPAAVAETQKATAVNTFEEIVGVPDSCDSISVIRGNKKPRLRSVKALLKQATDDKAQRAAEEAERIAANLATAEGLIAAQGPYKPGWVDEGGKNPKLYPFHLPLDKFVYPDDRAALRSKSGLRLTVAAQDYSNASEGAGRVTVRSSDYDVEEPEVFTPRGGILTPMDARGGWGKHDPLGFDTKSDLAGAMSEAVKAWASMTTPPPKTADPTVEALISDYLANGGDVQTFVTYQTTSKTKLRFKNPKDKHPEWAGGTGLPRELRATKKRCGVRPNTGSKQWTLSA